MFGFNREKKKRGCLFRLIKAAVLLGVGLFFLDIFLDVMLDDTEYISEQEQTSEEDVEDVELDELLDLFFDWYGYLPDDKEDLYHFMEEEIYADYDYDNYEDYEDDEEYESNDSSPHTGGSSSENRRRFLEKANAFKGTPYVYGGTSHSGVDCSGLVYCAAKEAGLGTLPHSSKSLYNISKKIDRSDAIEGDLIFFAAGSSISHVAIYIGDNQILHAISDGPKTGVRVSKLSEKYWKNHYYASGRIFD
jgi:hypothetical protein